jgi:hypothetical protein
LSTAKVNNWLAHIAGIGAKTPVKMGWRGKMRSLHMGRWRGAANAVRLKEE